MDYLGFYSCIDGVLLAKAKGLTQVELHVDYVVVVQHISRANDVSP